MAVRGSLEIGLCLGRAWADYDGWDVVITNHPTKVFTTYNARLERPRGPRDHPPRVRRPGLDPRDTEGRDPRQSDPNEL